jgi:hypothetical protein
MTIFCDESVDQKRRSQERRSYVGIGFCSEIRLQSTGGDRYRPALFEVVEIYAEHCDQPSPMSSDSLCDLAAAEACCHALGALDVDA